VGDHIYGDIVKSKKERAWHTFLIVPEIQCELRIWHEKRDLYTEIERLGDEISRIFV
jgi:5'-nucleotidase